MMGNPGILGKSIDLSKAPVCTNGDSECVREGNWDSECVREGNGDASVRGEGPQQGHVRQHAGSDCPPFVSLRPCRRDRVLAGGSSHDVAHKNTVAPAVRLVSV